MAAAASSSFVAVARAPVRGRKNRSVFSASNEVDNSLSVRGPQADFVWDDVIDKDLAGTVGISARWNPDLIHPSATGMRLRLRGAWDNMEVRGRRASSEMYYYYYIHTFI
jgi:hypothetical protein